MLVPDEAVALPPRLLESLPPGGPPVLSWSRVAAPALVLGRAPRDPALDAGAARAMGLRVLRRRSGGGPVLWDAGLLALDAVLPRGHRLAPGDVVEAYRWLGEAIAEGLRGLGAAARAVGVAEARAAARRAGPAGEACFGSLSPFEVVVDGRKAVGLSQARRARGSLVQAGVLLRLDASALARALGRDGAFARDLEARAVGLEAALPGVTVDDVVAAVEAALRRREGVVPA